MLIGLVGASGAGKSTVAEILKQEHGFSTMQIGQPIKDMLSAIGIAERNLRGTPEDKAERIELLSGRSARFAMKALSTDWGRRTISPDIWVNVARERLKRVLNDLEQENDNPIKVVIDDVRFKNDWKLIQESGGILVCVRNSKVEPKRNYFDHIANGAMPRFAKKFIYWSSLAKIHETEYFWPYAPVKREISNEATFEQLRENVSLLVNESSSAAR